MVFVIHMPAAIASACVWWMVNDMEHSYRKQKICLHLTAKTRFQVQITARTNVVQLKCVVDAKIGDKFPLDGVGRQRHNIHIDGHGNGIYFASWKQLENFQNDECDTCNCNWGGIGRWHQSSSTQPERDLFAENTTLSICRGRALCKYVYLNAEVAAITKTN